LTPTPKDDREHGEVRREHHAGQAVDVLGDDVAAAREWLTGPYRLSAWNEKLGTAPEPPAEDDPKAIRTVGVIGGGTAGYFTALALKAQRPWLEVSLVESADIPIIGVGEATVSYMVMFLHHYLGIDPAEFYQRVRPTWKLGIKFEWGSRPEGFVAPFGWGSNSAGGHVIPDEVPAVRVPHTQRPPRPLRHRDGGTARRPPGGRGGRRGAARRPGPGWRPDRRRRLRFDFYVDCTGFRSLLEKTLGTPFESYASTCSPTPPSPAPSRTAATSSRTRWRAR
jgi:tryptophan halogenase